MKHVAPFLLLLGRVYARSDDGRDYRPHCFLRVQEIDCEAGLSLAANQFKEDLHSTWSRYRMNQPLRILWGCKFAACDSQPFKQVSTIKLEDVQAIAKSQGIPPPTAANAVRAAAVGVRIVLKKPKKERTIMNLIKWDPLRELEDISTRLNRVFGRAAGRTASDSEMLAMPDWMPSVDISETDAAYLIKGEIPGVRKDAVKVTIQDGMLTIQGERKQEKEEKGKKFHRVECSYGSFVRSFRVPDDADENKIKAEFKDGMLNVTLPKSEKKTKAKSINVPLA